MYRRSYRRTHHHNTQPRGPFGFLRRPAVQLGILGIAALVVIIIAVMGNK